MQLKQHKDSKGFSKPQFTILFSCKGLSAFVTMQNKQKNDQLMEKTDVRLKVKQRRDRPRRSPGSHKLARDQLNPAGKKITLAHARTHSWCLNADFHRLPWSLITFSRGTGRGQGRTEERKTERERRRE